MKGIGIGEIDFELESLCPMKMDRWVGEEYGKKPSTKEDYIKQAELKVYTNGDGLYLPCGALEAALRHAAYYMAPKNTKTRVKDDVYAFVNVHPQELPLGQDTHDGIVEDVVTRVTGAGKDNKVTRVTTYRPIVKKWKVKGKLTYIEEGSLTPKFLKDTMIMAGVRFGLLSHRPKFGKFVITKWKVKSNGHRKKEKAT